MPETSNAKCKTKYPIVLIHGAGFRDLKWPVYWGRIPAALKKEGADIYYGLQDCWGSIETNARQIALRIDEILKESGSEKVNIIAHSKGGLDARMAASSLGCTGKIASITTIATPHHGSKVIDRLFKIPHSFWNIAAFAVNNWIRVVGDKKPDFLALCKGFTTEQMRIFNSENPDAPGIFYQSAACVMSRPFSDINLSTANFIVNRIEGPNDGLVSVDSAEWGENFRVLRANGFRGISHLDAIDFRRAPLTYRRDSPRGEKNRIGDVSRKLCLRKCRLRKSSPREKTGITDICDFYIELVADLKQRGF